jgi:NADH:ubiquinone oxidoreductase subunit 3 (subunit A)
MFEAYLGLLGLLAVGFGAAYCLFAMAGRLRRIHAGPSSERTTLREPPSGKRIAPIGSSRSRYFFVAMIGLMLHAGSFYFYLWGATIRKAGLTGLMVMLGFGMCLMMGVFYSWARGAVTLATVTETESEHSDLRA